MAHTLVLQVNVTLGLPADGPIVDEAKGLCGSGMALSSDGFRLQKSTVKVYNLGGSSW
jgi:hypothetical protein